MMGLSFILGAATLLASVTYLSANPFTGNDPLCPSQSRITTYYPNPNDCSEFFECYEGRKYVLKCNTDLFWNQEKLQCDYLQNVNCNRNNAICANKADGTYLKDPTDCSKYYECVGHKALGGRCPPGTLWNEVVINCDHPYNVVC